METEGGNFLNVTLKNKIIQSDTILDFLKDHKYKNKDNQDEIKNILIGRSFKVSYAKRNYKIDDISFDRNPQNQKINHDGKTKTLIKYVEEMHQKTIKDKTQPLILVKRTGPQGQENILYFIPELCNLSGLEDDSVKDGMFMRELANYTKLNPTERVKKTNEFLDLLVDPSKKENNQNNLSAKEKSELFGIEIKPVDKLFDAYYMKETELIGGSGKKVQSNDRTFPVLDKVDMTSWLCFYENSNYNDAANLYDNLAKAAKAYKLNIEEPEWVEMPNKSSGKDWTATADEYIGKGKKDYTFAVFLLGKNDRIYPDLKKHSLVKNGYVSQVVKASSLGRKGILSVCSNFITN